MDKDTSKAVLSAQIRRAKRPAKCPHDNPAFWTGIWLKNTQLTEFIRPFELGGQTFVKFGPKVNK